MYKNNVISIGFTNDKVPEFEEVRGKDWVYYGETNNYPQYLVLLFNRSAKHNAIVTSKQLYIVGMGWVFDTEGMQGDDIISLRSFIDNPNPYETLQDLLSKTVLDVELFGGFYFKVTQKKGKKGQYISHCDYAKIRSNEDNTKFYYSDFWLNKNGEPNTNIKEDEYTVYPAYDADKPASESIYYYKMYRPNLNTYTLPDYIGAVPAIITDCEIANFHRAEIQNSFKGSKAVVFKDGIPSDDEINATEKRLKNKFSPTDSTGSMVVLFTDDPIRVPEILDLSAGDFADKYNALNDTIQQEIFVGHKVTSPMLFGVRVEGQLGGRNEMVDAYNIFQNTYVDPRQQVQEKVYNLFAPVKGKLKIKQLEPIMPSFSEATLSQILTKDEMREIIGREAIDTKNTTSTDADSLATLSPLVATKVLNQLTPNEVRNIIGKVPLPGGDLLVPSSDVTAPAAFSSCKHFTADDDLDFEVFSKYGESVDNYVEIKHKKFMFSYQDFALTKLDEAILDIIKKTPNISKEAIGKVLKIDKTKVLNSLENLVADGLVEDSAKGINATPEGVQKKIPSLESLVIRYKYNLRPGAPALVDGESRDFCKAMMANQRYYSREDIQMIGDDLGALYGIDNYNAFTRRGGWYHDPNTDTNLPFCRHIWEQILVKKIK
jgi:DNA-binding Lrp family transcriptional regulator